MPSHREPEKRLQTLVLVEYKMYENGKDRDLTVVPLLTVTSKLLVDNILHQLHKVQYSIRVKRHTAVRTMQKSVYWS